MDKSLTLKEIKKHIKEKGGITINRFMSMPNLKRYIVSMRGYERIITFKELKERLKEYGLFTLEHKGSKIGLWIYNNKLFIDLSKDYKSLVVALVVGVLNNQHAIYDLKKDKDIYLPKHYFKKIKDKWKHL